MLTERQNLLTAITTITKDYREGDLVDDPMSEDRVDRWVHQFDEGVQILILRELEHVMKKMYISKEHMISKLTEIVKLSGISREYRDRRIPYGLRINEEPKDFWRKSQFLRIQKRGNSQSELLSLLDMILECENGYRTEDCGGNGNVFIYIDDIIFTGTRAVTDLKEWIQEHAPDPAKLYVIVLADHKPGEYHLRKKLREAIDESGKEIWFGLWSLRTFEGTKKRKDDAEVLWPASLPDGEELAAYMRNSEYPFECRTPKSGTSSNYPNLFTSEEGRQLLERELLLKGIHIYNLSREENRWLKPLGFGPFGLGFGAMIVTYRNCPNNCPLALWWRNPTDPDAWYPLFPRKPYVKEMNQW